MAQLSVSEASGKFGLSVGHIRALLIEGTVSGSKFATVWMVNETSIKAYLATERKPGPKPKKKTANRKQGVDKPRRHRR